MPTDEKKRKSMEEQLSKMSKDLTKQDIEYESWKSGLEECGCCQCRSFLDAKWLYKCPLNSNKVLLRKPVWACKYQANSQYITKSFNNHINDGYIHLSAYILKTWWCVFHKWCTVVKGVSNFLSNSWRWHARAGLLHVQLGIRLKIIGFRASAGRDFAIDVSCNASTSNGYITITQKI